MRVLISLFIFFSTIAQADFTPNRPDSSVFELLLTNAADSLTLDRTGTIATAITINGWASYAALADSLSGDNPFVSGGTSIQWNRTNGYLSFAAGAADALDMSASGVTVFFIAQNWEQFSTNSHQNGMFAFRRDQATNEIGYAFRMRGGSPYNGLFTRAGDGTNYSEAISSPSTQTLINDSAWHVYAASWGTNAQQFYIDGTAYGFENTDTFVPGLNHLRPYFIGTNMDAANNPVANQYFIGRVAYVLVVQDELSAAEIRKVGFLANGLNSALGNVTRRRDATGKNWKFEQDFWSDTLSVSVP